MLVDVDVEYPVEDVDEIMVMDIKSKIETVETVTTRTSCSIQI